MKYYKFSKENFRYEEVENPYKEFSLVIVVLIVMLIYCFVAGIMQYTKDQKEIKELKRKIEETRSTPKFLTPTRYDDSKQI